jgi:hypothetical protein
MIHYVFIAATWLIGLFGVGGAIAVIAGLIFLGPAAVAAIVQPLVTKFMSCIWCIVVVVFVLSTTGAYWVGIYHEASLCRADELSAKLRNAQIDRDNAVAAKTDESNRANQIETDADDQHRKDLADIASLKNRPPTCAFDDVDSGGVPNNKSGAGVAQPSSGAGTADAKSAGPVPHKRLLLPMVRNSWLPWRGRASDAPAHK